MSNNFDIHEFVSICDTFVSDNNDDKKVFVNNLLSCLNEMTRADYISVVNKIQNYDIYITDIYNYFGTANISTDNLLYYINNYYIDNSVYNIIKLYLINNTSIKDLLSRECFKTFKPTKSYKINAKIQIYDNSSFNDFLSLHNEYNKLYNDALKKYSKISITNPSLVKIYNYITTQSNNFLLQDDTFSYELNLLYNITYSSSIDEIFNTNLCINDANYISDEITKSIYRNYIKQLKYSYKSIYDSNIDLLFSNLQLKTPITLYNFKYNLFLCKLLNKDDTDIIDFVNDVNNLNALIDNLRTSILKDTRFKEA